MTERRNGILLSPKDSLRIEEAIRAIEQKARAIRPTYRRRQRFIPGGGGGGGLDVHLAYCKEDAGASSSIACWLDYRERNVQVWRNIIPFAAGQIATYADKFWLSKENNNTGNIPAENTHWTEIKAYNEATTYNITTAIWCLYDNKLWRSLQAGNIGHIPTEGAWWTTKAPAYNPAENNLVGARRTYGGKLYRCIQAGSGKTPATEPLYWTEILEIEVYCNIAGGNSLQFAFPLLQEQQQICVVYNATNARYEAIDLFAACEVTCAAGGMLELVNEMLVTDIANSSDSVWSDGQYVGIGLRFSAYAQSTYIIEFSILYTAAATTTGIVLGVSGPADKLSVSGIFYGHDGTSTPANLAGKSFNDYYGIDACTFAASAPGVNFIRGECVLQTFETPGEFVLKFHSEANGSEVKLKIGSNIKYRRIYRASTWPSWIDSTPYVVNDKVSYGGKTWKCIQNGTGHTPAEGVWWTEVAG